MRVRIVCTAVALVLGTVLLGTAAEKDVFKPDTFFPENTLFYYEFSDVSRTVGKLKELPVMRAVALVRNILDEAGLKQRIPGAAEWQTAGEELAALSAGRAACGVYPVKGKEGEEIAWSAAAYCGKLTEEKELARESLLRRVQNLLGISTAENADYVDYTITSFFKAKKEVFAYTFFQGWFVAGSGKNEVIKAVYRMKERRKGVLADNMMYKLLLRNAEEADSRFFMDAAGLGRTAKKALPPEIGRYTAFLSGTGIDRLQAVAGVMRVEKTAVKEIFSAYFDEQKGLIALCENLKKASFPFEKIPSSSFQVGCVNLDPAALWETVLGIIREYPRLVPESKRWVEDVETVLREIEVKSGLNIRRDLLDKLHNTIVSFSFPPSPGTGKADVLFPVYGVESFDAGGWIKNLVKLFNEGLSCKLSERTSGGHKIYYRQFPGCYVAFMRMENTVFASLHPDVLARLVTLGTGKGGSILADKEFSRFLGKGEFVSFSYTDIEKFFRYLGETYGLKNGFTLKALVERLSGGKLGGGAALVPDISLPGCEEMGKWFGRTSSRTTYRNNTLTCTCISPFPVHFAAGGAAFVASRALPLIKAAHEKKRVAVSRKRLETIAFNLELYAMEHNGSYPESLADLYPVYVKNLDVFAPPGREASLTMKSDIGKKGMFVYRRILNIARLKPTDVIVYQKKGIHPGGFFVLLRSGTIQWAPPAMYERVKRSVEGRLGR